MPRPRSPKPSPSSGAASTPTSTGLEQFAAPAEEVSEPLPPRPTSAEGLTRSARAGTIELTEGEEQFIRDQIGFTSSEKRTLAERDAAARRMREKLTASTPPSPPGTVARGLDASGQEVFEPLGPAGLSLVAFPNQVEGDLAPTAEERAKLG